MYNKYTTDIYQSLIFLFLTRLYEYAEKCFRKTVIRGSSVTHIKYNHIFRCQMFYSEIFLNHTSNCQDFSPGITFWHLSPCNPVKALQ